MSSEAHTVVGCIVRAVIDDGGSAGGVLCVDPDDKPPPLIARCVTIGYNGEATHGEGDRTMNDDQKTPAVNTEPKTKTHRAQLHKMADLARLRGGTFGATFAVAMKRAIADCASRPSFKKARKITMTVTVTPHVTQNGEVLLHVDQDVKTALPPLKPEPAEAMLVSEDLAEVRLGGEDDATQMTLAEGAGDE